jgi:hypothetical protein
MVSRQASMSRMAGWEFFFHPFPGQSPSELPIETLIPQFETLTPQCAYLALLFVSGGTARRLSRQQPDRFYVPPRRQAVFRTRSGR